MCFSDMMLAVARLLIRKSLLGVKEVIELYPNGPNLKYFGWVAYQMARQSWNLDMLSGLIRKEGESLFCTTAGSVVKERCEVGGVDEAGGLSVIWQARHHLDDRRQAVHLHLLQEDQMLSASSHPRLLGQVVNEPLLVVGAGPVLSHPLAHQV